MRIASAYGPGSQHLTLRVYYPPDYPSASAPVVELDADGLSDVKRQSLLHQLDTMFEPGEVHAKLACMGRECHMSINLHGKCGKQVRSWCTVGHHGFKSERSSGYSINQLLFCSRTMRLLKPLL